MADKDYIGENEEATEVPAEETAEKTDVKAPAADSKKAAEKSKKPGFFSRFFTKLRQGWKDYKGELKKITWPTFKQTANNTLVVIAAMIIMGLFVFALDTAFTQIIKWLAEIGK